MKKIYSSFKEIDRDLEQLSLQKQIEVTTVKLRFEETKRALSPTNMFTNIVTDIVANFARKAIFLKIFNKIVGR